MMSVVLLLLVFSTIDLGSTQPIPPNLRRSGGVLIQPRSVQEDTHLQSNVGKSDDSEARLARAVNMNRRNIVEEKEPAEDFDIEEEDLEIPEVISGNPLPGHGPSDHRMDVLDHNPATKSRFKVPRFFTQERSHTQHTINLGITYDKDVQHIDFFEVIVLQLELDEHGIPRMIDTDTSHFESFISYTQMPHDGIPYIAARFRAEDLPGELVVGDGLHYAGFINGPLNPGSYYSLFIRGIREGEDGHAIHESSEFFSDVNSPDKPAFFMTRNPANKIILLLPVALGSVILLLSILFMYFMYMVKLNKLPKDNDLERSLSGVDCGYHKVPTNDNKGPNKSKKLKLKRPMTKREKSQKKQMERLWMKNQIMEDTLNEHFQSLEAEEALAKKKLSVEDEICVADLVSSLSFNTAGSEINIKQVDSGPNPDRDLKPQKVIEAEVTVHNDKASIASKSGLPSVDSKISQVQQAGLTKSEEDVYAEYLKEQGESTDLTDFSLYPTDDERAPPKKRVIHKPVHKSQKTKPKRDSDHKPTPIEVVTDEEDSDSGDENPPPAKKPYEPVKQEGKPLLVKQPKELKEKHLRDSFRHKSLHSKHERQKREKAAEEFESRRKSLE